MYKDFYHLKKEPFNITPDPEFLFLSPSHKEALASIIYGVEQRKGFIVVEGKVGVGKTTILRSYLERIEGQLLKVIYIFNSNISFKDLLKTIFQELGLNPETDTVPEMVKQLHQVMIEEYKQGNNVVLVIDEAQNMPVETMEDLRMLSNLETATDKLIQIVLVGQPEIEQIFSRDELKQLKQRIAIRSSIVPLTKKESFDYIKHRLATVATNDTMVFTKDALKKIVKKAKGIPRTINILCDNALITGYGYQRNPVDSRVVGEVIGDLEGKRKQLLLKWGVVFSALLLLVAGVFWILPHYQYLLIPKTKSLAPSQDYQTQLLPGAKNPVNLPDDRLTVSTVEKAPVVEKVIASPAVENTPLPKKAMLSPKKKNTTVRIIKRGDTLYSMVRDVYGFSNYKLIEHVKESNPGMEDINKIRVGQKIVFPKLEERQKIK